MMTDYSPAVVNYAPLSPISFLTRAKDIFPHRVSVVYGNREYTWQETYSRCVQLALALSKLGIKQGDVVSVLLQNTPEMVEAHFGIPMAGGVLNTINTRLDVATLVYILSHSEAKCLIVDRQFSVLVKKVFAELNSPPPIVIEVVDSQSDFSTEDHKIASQEYESFLATAERGHHEFLPKSEWQTIALNYTSGTSGKPKGVLYHHRGAYLMAMGTVSAWSVPRHLRYLYTVPMFHCNGWGHCWMNALQAGTIYCLRQVSAENIFQCVEEYKITHFGGAPIVLSLLVNAPKEVQRKTDYPLQVMTAGAPPAPAILEKCQELGFEVMQVYGLTETYGHVMQCLWQTQWDDWDFPHQARIKARQGVRFPICEEIRVLDSESGLPVAADGESVGEIVVRGNTVMKGYHRDPEATAEAFRGDVFHSADVAVVHPDGYIEVKDRLKDVIISGGENISSVEVEAVLFKHPAVLLAAVVAMPDEKWGEIPCAFLECSPEMATPTESEIITFAREQLAGFKVPKKVFFEVLPKTATGKIQKFSLREKLFAQA